MMVNLGVRFISEGIYQGVAGHRSNKCRCLVKAQLEKYEKKDFLF
jgi:hypothetical protein